eukprot:TRINITY_DN7800_c0_g1_i5.p1 TRINITY_DN7800_c0_g1~~TRINITY_DN7800_c0_g1_i5.p1  ORF type:complete len:217 (+),score=31.12 TRINITY_DN7800_c0_g1_i5:364-1014(+)
MAGDQLPDLQANSRVRQWISPSDSYWSRHHRVNARHVPLCAKPKRRSRRRRNAKAEQALSVPFRKMARKLQEREAPEEDISFTLQCEGRLLSLPRLDGLVAIPAGSTVSHHELILPSLEVTSIERLVRQGNLEACKQLVAADSSLLMHINQARQNLLHIAAWSGQADCMAWLLQCQSGRLQTLIGALDKDGWTAIDYARVSDSASTLNLLQSLSLM